MADSVRKERILIVDDTPNTLEVLQRNLTSQGYQTFIASHAAEAIKILDVTPIDLVVTDFKMPGVSGLDLIRHVRENFKKTEVMMITGYPTVEGAVEAVKKGAEEYLVKPFTDEELLSAISRTLDKLRLRMITKAPLMGRASAPYGLIGGSEAMARVRDSIAKVASASATV
ncbi:MAG: sigma-54-dependent Fis family transcriptional regulator, partial [Syntrophaceae bacterium]|nr:sigma-54-dependent Fis family transcriptional regulator [Syntrophaceae bacterium]